MLFVPNILIRESGLKLKIVLYNLGKDKYFRLLAVDIAEYFIKKGLARSMTESLG